MPGPAEIPDFFQPFTELINSALNDLKTYTDSNAKLNLDQKTATLEQSQILFGSLRHSLSSAANECSGSVLRTLHRLTPLSNELYEHVSINFPENIKQQYLEQLTNIINTVFEKMNLADFSKFSQNLIRIQHLLESHKLKTYDKTSTAEITFIEKIFIDYITTQYAQFIRCNDASIISKQEHLKLLLNLFTTENNLGELLKGTDISQIFCNCLRELLDEINKKINEDNNLFSLNFLSQICTALKNNEEIKKIIENSTELIENLNKIIELRSKNERLKIGAIKDPHPLIFYRARESFKLLQLLLNGLLQRLKNPQYHQNDPVICNNFLKKVKEVSCEIHQSRLNILTALNDSTELFSNLHMLNLMTPSFNLVCTLGKTPILFKKSNRNLTDIISTFNSYTLDKLKELFNALKDDEIKEYALRPDVSCWLHDSRNVTSNYKTEASPVTQIFLDYLAHEKSGLLKDIKDQLNTQSVSETSSSMSTLNTPSTQRDTATITHHNPTNSHNPMSLCGGSKSEPQSNDRILEDTTFEL